MKKKASRRLVAAFTMAAMLVTLMPSGAAFAAPAEEAGEATQATAVAAKTAPKEVAGDTQEAGKNQYVSYEWDYDQEQLVRSVKEIPRYATVVTQDNINDVWSNGIIQGGTYVIEGDVTVNGPLTVDGFADIILKDRSQLNALQGIRLENGAHLEIFSQSEKSWNMGKLFANSAEKNGYGIGGGDAGCINIFGGFVKATGVNSPGLGAGNIEIYNGDITAKSNNEAAIGSKSRGNSTNVYIYNGKVHATSDTCVGIGGGRGSAAGNIMIRNGEITTNGEIGIGIYNGGDIWIKDGVVEATGKEMAIGTAGYNGHCGDISIDGGEVTAIGGDLNGWAGGIGCDDYSICGDVRISSGEVILKNNRGIYVPDFKEVKVTGGSIDVGYNGTADIKGSLSIKPLGSERIKIRVDGIYGENINITRGDITCVASVQADGNINIKDSIVGSESGIFARNVSIEDGEIRCSAVHAECELSIRNADVWADVNGEPIVGSGISGEYVSITGGRVAVTGNLSSAGIMGEDIYIRDASVSVDTVYREAGGINGLVHIFGNSCVSVPDVLDNSDEENWSGLIIEGHRSKKEIGKIYGNHFILSDDILLVGMLTIPKGATLTVEEGYQLWLADGILINEGTIDGSGNLFGSPGFLIGSGSVAETIDNELTDGIDVTLTSSVEEVAEGQSLTLTLMAPMDNLAENMKDYLQNATVEFYRGNTLLDTVPLNESGIAISDEITVSKKKGWLVGESYNLDARVISGDVLCALGTCKVSVVKPAEAAPVTPSKKAVTDTSVTLNTIAKSANGAKALYGMKATDGSFTWQDVPYFDNLKPNTDYIFAAKYEAAGDQAESPLSKEVTIRTAKSSKSDQPAPAAPVKKSVTASSVTLKTISDSSVGGKVQYGMKDATGVTKWQDSPVFENLKADTAYTFVAQYMATDKYNASAISAETVIRTEKKNSTDLLSPIILNSTGGQTAVTVTNPKPGQAVTIITAPDKGYEVDNVKVTDENGNVIEVTKNANGQYVFNQPDTQVTIKVTYKKAVTSDEPQKPEEPEPPQGDNWNNPFTDVPKGAWYNDAVRYVYENGLMVGLAPNNFGANVTTDRGQLVTMLWRMAGEPQATNGADFSDVPSNAYYANAVAWAAENGITSGFEDGTFRPQTGLSREQMAALFMKYAEATGVDTSVRADISSYTDINPNSWSYDALSWAKAVGLLSGVSDTTMAPQATATRAQIAAVLQRYCETVAK